MGRNEDLVKRVQDGETDLMGELWENNTGLVALVAKRYQEGCGRLVDFDDLMQAGYLGLYAAAMTYSPERAAFSTYVVFHLRRAMRPVVGLLRKRDALFDACPLDAPLGDDGDGTLLDMIAAPLEEDLVELKDLQRIVREAVARIRDKKTREAIEAVYWRGATLEDYAQREGITRAGAGVRLQQGYAMLRRDPAIVSHELEALDKALASIRDDLYYLAVYGKYIQRMSDEEIAKKIFELFEWDMPCHPTTIWKNRKRLVQRVAVRLYGAYAVK